MTFPAISYLRHLYPEAELELLACPWVMPVYKCHPDVNQVIDYDRLPGLAGAVLSRLKAAQQVKAKKYDLGLVLPNSFESALIFKMAGLPCSIGYGADFRKMLLTNPVAVPGDKDKRHQVFYYLDLVNQLDNKDAGPPPSVLDIHLDIPEHAATRAAGFISRVKNSASQVHGGMLVGFNPGAAFGPAKCWPADRFMKLARLLLSEFPSLNILVFGTKREMATGERIKEADPMRVINLCGRTSLTEAIALINKLDLLVTNDSGLMHVGAACSTALVAIFGSTSPVATGPWSKKATVISHHLDCAPCMNRTCSRNFECMMGISAQEVFDASRAVLWGKAGSCK